MSVATRNPFALLNEDDVAEASPPVAPSSTPSQPPPKPASKDQKPKTGPASRGGRYYQRGGTARNVVKDTQEVETESTPRENRKAEGAERGRGRGGRGGRGRGAGARGRQFDRHSGTLPDTNKRVTQGWGDNKGSTELSAEQQGDADAAKDANVDTTVNWGAELATPGAADAPAADSWGGDDAKDNTPKANGKPESRPHEEEEEEEDHSLTLDEYLAKKAKAEAAVVPKLETVRQANEGVDESQWKDAIPLTKSKEDSDYFVGKTKATPKARPKKEEKVHIEIDAHFERPARGGRGGRGDRGGDRSRGFPFGRGRGGRGGPRESAQPDVNVADQSAFPSLA